MGDKGGIYSLAGFAYQIKVFFLQILELKPGNAIEYETIDDVALRMSADNIDNHEDELYSVLSATRKKVIQVKKTSVTNSIAQKIVKNWLVTDANTNNIDQFVLVTDREVDSNVFVNINIDGILKEIRWAKGSKSIEAKIKAIGYPEMELKNRIQNIISKAITQIYENIDEKIESEFGEFLIRDGVKMVTYYRRIKEFLQQITVEILDAVTHGQSYILTYERMSQIRNRIVTNINDEKWEPSFSHFRKLHKVSLEDLAAIKPREYQQLLTCQSLEEDDICRHLLWSEYYVNSKRGYYERGMNDRVDALEYTAYDNFCDTKMELRKRVEDTPDNRLIETKAKSNSKAVDEQIRYGVCISLTSEDTDKSIQISWKDD